MFFYIAAKCPQTTIPNHPSPGLSPHPSDSYTPSLVSPGCPDLKPPAYFSMPNGSRHPTSEGPADMTELEKPLKALSVSEQDEGKGHDQLDEHHSKLRDNFETQLLVDPWVHPVFIVLNNDNHWNRMEPLVNWWLGFEVVSN